MQKIRVMSGEGLTDVEYLDRIAVLLQSIGHQVEASTLQEIATRVNARRKITSAEIEEMNGYLGTTLPSLKAALRSIGHTIEGDE